MSILNFFLKTCLSSFLALPFLYIYIRNLFLSNINFPQKTVNFHLYIPKNMISDFWLSILWRVLSLPFCNVYNLNRADRKQLQILRDRSENFNCQIWSLTFFVKYIFINEGKEERAERDKLSEFCGKKIAYYRFLLVKTCANPSPCLLLSCFS